MLSFISHPHTTLLRTLWTSERIPRLATHGLNLISCTAYSALSSCGLSAVRPSSLALHFFPHTRPPDIAAHHLGGTTSPLSTRTDCVVGSGCHHRCSGHMHSETRNTLATFFGGLLIRRGHPLSPYGNFSFILSISVGHFLLWVLYSFLYL
jgi:hypothetical protein